MFECVVLAAVLGAGCQPEGSPKLTFRSEDGYTIGADLHVPASASAAPLVVLGHQLERDRRSWDSLVPELLASGYAVVAVDHRGFGASTKEAASPDELPESARDRLSEDLEGAIDAASAASGVDPSRVAVIGTGISTSPAVRCALERPQVRALVLFPGVLGADEEDFLLSRPDLPILMLAAADDESGVGLMRQYAGRFSGPTQTYLEMPRVVPGQLADWRGTDGLQGDTGLADALLWFLTNHFPASGSSGSSGSGS